jgi:UPF0042 nucleotide-binding protein
VDKEKTKRSNYRSSRGSSKSSRVVIITGLSGSGKTVALRAVEDLNFFCVDNLPVSLISSLISKISGHTGGRNIAIGIDIREKEFLSDIERVLIALRKKRRIEVLFLEAEKEVLIRRFKETRRPHPLGGDLEDAIGKEKESLKVIKQNADRVIDTSSLSPHQLRKLISSLYLPQNSREKMSVSLISFGFKYGIPQNIDLLFDVRFLPNPHFIPVLKELDGTDREVAEYVFGHSETREFVRKIRDLLNFLLPLYIREGRSYLSIGIGCTGGRHRSPAIVEEVAKYVKNDSIALNVIHRDIS